MEKRQAKQFLYGSFFIVSLATVFLLIYAGLNITVPSCMDNIQNQREEETDCGGPCLPCAMRDLKLNVLTTKIIPITSLSKTTLVAVIDNPSVDFWGQKFNFVMRVYNSLGVVISNFKGQSYINPGSERPIAFVAEDLDPRDVKKIELEISDIKWDSIENYNDEGIRLLDSSLYGQGEKVYVRGVVQNISSKNIDELKIGANFYSDRNALVNVSTTLVDNLEAFSSKDFQITLILDSKKTDIQDVDLFFEIIK